MPLSAQDVKRSGKRNSGLIRPILSPIANPNRDPVDVVCVDDGIKRRRKFAGWMCVLADFPLGWGFMRVGNDLFMYKNLNNRFAGGEA
jgi:hypothetical protein